MEKIHTNLNLEKDLVKKAKELQLNISGEVNEFLKTRVNSTIDAEEEELKCFKCGVQLPKQTAADLNNGLVWLCPEEKWICPGCLNFKVRQATIAIATRR